MQTRFERGSFRRFYEIVINFRSQRRIEELAEEAKKLIGGNLLEGELTAKDVPSELTATQLLIAGGYCEQIGKWHNVALLADLALKRPKEELNDEIEIMGNFILATRLREDGQNKEAVTKYESVLELAKNTEALDEETKAFWIINTKRNIGLADLKLGEANKQDPTKQTEALENYKAGLEAFETAFNIAQQHEILKGSLPALYNYIALMNSKIYPNEPSVYIKFQEAAKLYEKIFREFAEQGAPVTEKDKATFHDLQSHYTHNANFLRNYAKTLAPAEREEMLKSALQILVQAYKQRETNKADGQRLGDSAMAIAGAYRDLNQLDNAIEAAGIAKKHYEDNNKAFHPSGEKTVTTKIQTAESLLNELKQQKQQAELKAPPPWMNTPYQAPPKPQPNQAPSLTPQQFKPL